MNNTANLNLFTNPSEADKWVWRVTHGIKDWIRKHNKSFWYLVLYESRKQGTLKESVTRKEFSRLLIQECADALSPYETENKLFHSIESFRYKSELKKGDKMLDKSIVRGYVNEVSWLLTQDVVLEDISKAITIEQRLKEYLTMTTANETYTEILIRPNYNGKRATMSVESYVSQKFKDEKRPSHRVIYECIDEKLTAEKIEMLSGRFGSLSNTKLFIASTHTYSSSVMKEAERHNIGLILVNLNKKISEHCFVLPRSQSGQIPEESLWMQMLTGRERMTEPIIVFDGKRIDNSLSYALYKYAACDKKNLFVTAPILRDAYIEVEALRLVKTLANQYVLQLQNCGPNDKVPACVIDPYQIAKELNLTVKRGKTDGKLGQIDIKRKKVTLSNRLNYDDTSDRFSMAHEIGHNILHQQVSKKAEDGCHQLVSNTKKWLEHHAHYFASCLLMPTPVISLLYNIYWTRQFKSKAVQPLQISENFYNDSNFQHVVGPIARKMKVSLQAACIRLKKMGLIVSKE